MERNSTWDVSSGPVNVPGIALVSCPLWDWSCELCDRKFNEEDVSRRWVTARPCPSCGSPMTTWRKRGELCDIFKPEGSRPSPREDRTQQKGHTCRQRHANRLSKHSPYSRTEIRAEDKAANAVQDQLYTEKTMQKKQ